MGFSFKVKKDQLPEVSTLTPLDRSVLEETAKPADAAPVEHTKADRTVAFSLESQPNVPLPPPEEVAPESDVTVMTAETQAKADEVVLTPPMGGSLLRANPAKPVVESQDSIKDEKIEEAPEQNAAPEQTMRVKTESVSTQSAFLERSKITGIAPPPRASTATG
ncbi:MAG: hypothetical protein V4692_14055, partial [Bdellovibrionota bacterium]